ncbi:sodium:proton antiporter [soil metagenome]
MTEHHLLVVLVAIVAIGVASQWLAWRTRLPAFVILSIAGLIAGPGLGVLDPAAAFGDLLRPVISLCVAVILFEGGLSLELHELRAAAQGVRRLVYIGAPLAWVLSALAAHYIGGLEWAVAVVFGAIMIVTGPTVIMPLLRQTALNRRTASYLKWEGIVNDPIGALLAVLSFQFFISAGAGSGWAAVAGGVGLALLAAVLLGGVGGWLTGKVFLKGYVPEYLKSPVMMGVVLVVYALSNSLQHEAGLLAVVIMGVVIGNMRLPGIDDMKRFKEYLSLMLVAVVFVLLTANLDPAVIHTIDWRGVALVAAILLITRPATVFLATLGAGLDSRDRLLLMWIAPRGIVAAATAGLMGPSLARAGYEDAAALLPLVFAVIFVTVFLHGLSIGWLEKRLGLASQQRGSVLIVGASPWSTELALTLQKLEVNVLIADDSWHDLRAARIAGVKFFYGEILSDFADQAVELPHVSTVIAATSNDAYNALVCTAMAPEIGRDRVFQLPTGETDDDPRSVGRELRGRLAFGPEAVFEKLWQHHVRGWVFCKTRITDSYSYSDFLDDCASRAIQILVLGEDGTVKFHSPDAELEPVPGDIVVHYAPARSADKQTPLQAASV